MLDIRCPNCERELHVPEEAAERSCECPVCNTVFSPKQSFGQPRRFESHDPDTHIAEASTPTVSCESDAHISEEPFPTNEDRHELDVLSERARFSREVNDQFAHDLANQDRWNASKSGAKTGFGIGCLMGIVGLLLDGRADPFVVFWGIFGSGLLTAADGFLIAALIYRTRPRNRTWVRRVMLGGAVLWVLAFVSAMRFSGEPYVRGVASGAAAGVFACFFVAGFLPDSSTDDMDARERGP